jgi:hypothetical protein
MDELPLQAGLENQNGSYHIVQPLAEDLAHTNGIHQIHSKLLASPFSAAAPLGVPYKCDANVALEQLPAVVTSIEDMSSGRTQCDRSGDMQMHKAQESDCMSVSNMSLERGRGNVTVASDFPRALAASKHNEMAMMLAQEDACTTRVDPCSIPATLREEAERISRQIQKAQNLQASRSPAYIDDNLTKARPVGKQPDTAVQEQAAGLSLPDMEIEASSDMLFQKLYALELPVSGLVHMLVRFSKSPPGNYERRIYECMVDHLLSERQHFPTYPKSELDLTADFLGQLLQYDLIPSGTQLGHAMRCIIGALRCPEGSKMLRFGKRALEQFKSRLSEAHPGGLLEQFSDTRSPFSVDVHAAVAAAERSSLSQRQAETLREAQVRALATGVGIAMGTNRGALNRGANDLKAAAETQRRGHTTSAGRKQDLSSEAAGPLKAGAPTVPYHQQAAWTPCGSASASGGKGKGQMLGLPISAQEMGHHGNRIAAMPPGSWANASYPRPWMYPTGITACGQPVVAGVGHPMQVDAWPIYNVWNALASYRGNLVAPMVPGLQQRPPDAQEARSRGAQPGPARKDNAANTEQKARSPANVDSRFEVAKQVHLKASAGAKQKAFNGRRRAKPCCEVYEDTFVFDLEDSDVQEELHPDCDSEGEAREISIEDKKLLANPPWVF